MNRLANRLGRLESKTPLNYSSVEEIPTPVLESMVQNAFRDGSLPPEWAELFRRLQEFGFEF